MKVIVVLRDLDPETGYPIVPETWTLAYQDNGWFTLKNPSGQTAFLRNMATDGSKGAFIVGGPDSMLIAIYQNTTAWTIAELRADNGVAATRIKNAWKDERPKDDAGNPIGSKVALYATIAGFTLDRNVEDTSEKP